MEILKLNGDVLQIIMFLAPGYFAFRIYLIDKNWNSINVISVIYGSLAFSALSYATWSIFPANWAPSTNGILFLSNFLIAILYAFLWRVLGHPMLHKLLNLLKITVEDNAFTPWTIIFGNPQINITVIIVDLKDGRSLKLDDTANYYIPEMTKAKVYPYYSSAEGDLTMVVTHTRPKDEMQWIAIDQVYASQPWGLKMSFIPAKEISRVEVRVLPRNLP